MYSAIKLAGRLCALPFLFSIGGVKQMTILVVIVMVYFFISGGVATLHKDWLISMYEDDSMESYLNRGILAVISFPLFVGCTISHWLYKRNRQLGTCRDCLYRRAAEKDGGAGVQREKREN